MLLKDMEDQHFLIGLQTLRFVKIHRINPGGSGEEANKQVFTDSGLGALGFSSSYERRRFALRHC